MNKNLIIFGAGLITGAIACMVGLFYAGPENRKKIFERREKPAEENPENNDGETSAETPENATDTAAHEHAENILRSDRPGPVMTDYSAYSKIAADYSTDDIESAEEPDTNETDGYIRPITPDEYNENGNYSAVRLIYYSDGVITDSSDIKIDNVKEILGDWDASLLGQYEPDVAYVRNDALMQDFEITRDLGTYEDVLKKKPYLADRKEDHD